jgi:5'-nucleotidase
MPSVATSGTDKVTDLLNLYASGLAMADRAAVEHKLRAIQSGGPEKLHLVADFDMTLTKYWVNGQRNVSSHGIVMRSHAMTDELRRRTDELYAFYYPMEVSHTLSKEEKTRAMTEWWEKAHEIILESKMKDTDVIDMVQRSKVVFRAGIDKLMERVEELSIPVLVFSAGLANVIEEILRQNNLLLPHLHIVSNVMLFDETGTVRDFAPPLIHVFNKSEAVLPDAVEVSRRPNILLMGDSIGDLRMTDGLNGKEVELTVGFLNHDVDRLKPQYLEAFDIVLLDDPPMDFVKAILNLWE